MLTQITPPVARVAVLFNPATAPFAGLMLHAIEEAAPSFAVAVRAAPVNGDSEVETMMAGLAREHGGVLVLPTVFTMSHRDAIITLAAKHRLPAVYPYPFFAAEGGLMSYGLDNCRSTPPCGRLCGSHPQGRQAGRSAGPTADQVRACDQPQDRQGAWADRPSVHAATRRRGDRIKRRLPLVAQSVDSWHRSISVGFGPKRTSTKRCGSRWGKPPAARRDRRGATENEASRAAGACAQPNA